MMLLMCQSIQGCKQCFKTQRSQFCVNKPIRLLIVGIVFAKVFSAVRNFIEAACLLFNRDPWTQNAVKISHDQKLGQSLGLGTLARVMFNNAGAIKQILRQQLMPKGLHSLCHRISNQSQLGSVDGLDLPLCSPEMERLLGLVESAWTKKMKSVFKQKESSI